MPTPPSSIRRTTSRVASQESMKCCGGKDYWRGTGALTNMNRSRRGKAKRLTAFTRRIPTSTTMISCVSIWMSGCGEGANQAEGAQSALVDLCHALCIHDDQLYGSPDPFSSGSLPEEFVSLDK